MIFGVRVLAWLFLDSLNKECSLPTRMVETNLVRKPNIRNTLLNVNNLNVSLTLLQKFIHRLLAYSYIDHFCRLYIWILVGLICYFSEHYIQPV